MKQGVLLQGLVQECRPHFQPPIGEKSQAGPRFDQPDFWASWLLEL